ncbi:MAG: hypothetical protein ACRERR_00810 [Moraxellaceae bacterium]
MKASVHFSLSTLLAAMLAGCGAGGTEEAVDASTTGVFRDSPVAGLWYQSTTGNNYTDSKGRFDYKPGETYTFFVGSVKLGSFTPTSDNATVTPANLAASADAGDRERVILNLVRFLMTVDQNRDPSDGITISADMDEDALKWPQLTFSDTDALTSTKAQTIMLGFTGPTATVSFDGITEINGATAYRSATDARDHLSDSMSCAYSGAFVGARSSGGSVVSRVAIIVNGDSEVSALQYFPLGGELYEYIAPSLFDYAGLLSTGSLKREVPSESNSQFILRYVHSATDVDKISINTTESGVFSGSNQSISRLAGKPTAIYRFAGTVAVANTPANDYVYALEIGSDAVSAGSSNKVVSGKVLDLHTGASATFSGSYNPGTDAVLAKATVGDRELELTGTLATASKVLTASIKETQNSVPITQGFTTSGCRLDEY